MQSNARAKWIIHSWVNWKQGEFLVVNQANEVDLWININDKGGKLDYQRLAKNQSVAKNWSRNLLLELNPVEIT